MMNADIIAIPRRVTILLSSSSAIISSSPKWAADQRFLEEVKITVEEFKAMVASSTNDDEMIELVQAHLAQNS